MHTKHILWASLASFSLVSIAFGQVWDADKVWYAGDPGSPNAFRYVDVDGSFPGWTEDDTTNVTHQAPSANAGGIGGLEGSYFRVINGKEKHRTSNGTWVFDGNGSTRTALFWRIYIPSTTPIEKLPSIQIRTHGERHHLDFDPDASGGAIGRSGWVSAEGVTINSGGLVKQDGSNELYLPMSMDEWHTIRVEITGPSGQFEAWIDEEEGLSDVKHITATATKDGTPDYIEIGSRSTVDFTQFWTNELAWGQDTTATGGVNAITPLMSPTMLIEDCDNGIDDDTDGLADCADPGCVCDLSPENNPTLCHNGLDDDGDTLVDCDDPDCADVATEDTVEACTNFIDDDCDGLLDCDDPDCAGLAVESSTASCINGLDDDCDGLIDCNDPDCGGLLECGEDQPHFELTMVRQVGDWQNVCNDVTCASVLYVSVYDEFGNPLDGVQVGDPIRGVNMVTNPDPGQGPDGQSGHARFDPFNPLDGVYRLRVITDNGLAVSSDTTPNLYALATASNKPFYSWQVEFMRKTQRNNPGDFMPEDPCYIFDAVELNPPTGPNTTLADDFSDFFTDGGDGFVQTFVPDGNRVVSARFELSIGFLQTFRYQVSIHPLLNDPPTSLADLGPEIGSIELGPNNMIDSEWWTQMMVWPVDGPDAVVVTPGEKYAASIKRADPLGTGYPGINALLSASNYYPNGEAYRVPTGTTNLVNDNPGYDVTGYIVCGTYGKCVNNPVFDVAGGGSGDEPDGAVDSQDFDAFVNCATGPTPDATLFDEEHVNYIGDTCSCMDVNGDLAIDHTDFATFQRCLGLTGAALDACDD